jgi:xylan 1,4-beta-xylosidase
MEYAGPAQSVPRLKLLPPGSLSHSSFYHLDGQCRLPQDRSVIVERMEKPTLAAAISLTVIAFIVHPAQSQRSAPVEVHIHSGHMEGAYTPIWNYFGADEPNYLYSPNGRKLLGELSDLSPAPVYIRTHNLFTTGDGSGSLKWGSTNLYTEQPDGRAVYDFTLTDRIFDALVAARVRPLVEIGFMPEVLSAHPDPYRHRFPKGDVFTGWSYPPKDEAAWSKWANLVVAYATHLRQRYGDQTRAWLWEVWNEPDIAYWHGTAEEYDRLYDVTAAAIREAQPGARIGGPEATGVSDHSEPFLRQFLEHCAHGVNAATGGKGAPLDFISYHPKGHPTFADGHVVMSVGTQLRAIERGMQVVASYPEWKNTPIILGESDPEGCGACQSPQNGYRNGSLYAVSITEATMRTYELARKYAVTIEGTVTWALEFEDQPFFAPLRSLATDGVDKPALNAFRLMGMLGGGPGIAAQSGSWVEVESSGSLPLGQVVGESVTGTPDVGAVATRSGGEVDVLLWNYHDADVDGPSAEVHLAVDGLLGKFVSKDEFGVDQTHSNAFTAWQKMGSPPEPEPDALHALERAGRLMRTSHDPRVVLREGVAEMNLIVPRQAVVLIRLRER